MAKEFPLVHQAQPELCVALNQYQLIEIVGADAEKYLQGQLTCDVTTLAVGSQTLTCHCDPKGKMSSLFRLYRQAPDQFVAIMPKSLLPEALVQLKKYAVFSKVAFNLLESAIFGTTSGQIFAEFSKNATACTVEGNPKRYLLWGEVSLPTNAESEMWDLLDIQQGVPLLSQATQFELIPQATNLQQLEQAISFTKGCYIGQETVARAKYRGANKRAMFTLVGEWQGGELPAIASAVEMQLAPHWKSTGTILAVALWQNQFWLQVVLNKTVEADSLFRVGNTPLTLFPLPYTLDENE